MRLPASPPTRETCPMVSCGQLTAEVSHAPMQPFTLPTALRTLKLPSALQQLSRATSSKQEFTLLLLRTTPAPPCGLPYCNGENEQL